MRNLFPIAVIGKNHVFRTGGCPLRNVDKEYDDYFKNLTYGGYIIMDEKTFVDLPNKIHPYPCCKLCVIGNPEIDAAATTVSAASSLEEAMSLVGNSAKVSIITNPALLAEVLEKYAARIACITIATIDLDFAGTEVFTALPPFQWQPRTKKFKTTKGKRSIGYSILRYKPEVIEI